MLTGATGFLGSHLLKKLLQHGYSVSVLKRSGSDCRRIEDELEKCQAYDIDLTQADVIFQEQKFDAVIHCATDYGKNEAADRVVNSNLIFPLQLLEAAIKAKCPYFINTDSFFTKQLPERFEKQQIPYSPQYTLSKYQFREWGRLRAIEGKVKFINLQMEHMYGPDDGEGKFVTFLIRSMQGGAEELNLTDGIQIRDFIYVDDVVSAYLAVLEHLEELPGYCHFEIGTGESHTVREFAETIRAELGAKTRLNFGKRPRTDSEIMFSTARIEPIKGIGFMPRVAVKEGVAQMTKHENGKIWNGGGGKSQ